MKYLLQTSILNKITSARFGAPVLWVQIWFTSITPSLPSLSHLPFLPLQHDNSEHQAVATMFKKQNNSQLCCIKQMFLFIC